MKNLKSAEAMTRNFQSKRLEETKIKKIASKFFFPVFFSLFFFSVFSPVAVANRIPEPNAGEKELLNLFKKFDDMYVKRQRGRISGNQWEKMGERFSNKLGNMGKKLSENWSDMDNQFSQEWNTFTRQNNIGMNFFLRSALIMGECYLFASKQYFPKYINLYEKGINTLDQVIIAAEILSKLYPDKKSEIDLLPDYVRDYKWIEKIDDGEISNILEMNPFAGRETIGTGIEPISAAGIMPRKVTYDISEYFDLKLFLKMTEDDLGHLQFWKQISTTKTARTLLSHFCPWGVDMYFLLKDAGLTKDLDLRILRPFSGYKPTPFEQIIKGFKEFPDAVMGRSVESQDKIPPVISESVLKPPQIPKHIFDEMNLIIGENGKGYLDTDKKRPIEWAGVEKEPTYTIWYTSPTVFDWGPSDYLWMWFTAVKSIFSPAGTIVDTVLTGLVDSIGAIYDKETDVYFAAKVAVEANDKGFLSTGFIEKGEWLSGAAVTTRKIASYTFSAIEKQMLQDRSEGIDPSKFSMGTTYNGTKIPPIIIRAEVFGFKKVPDDEYPRTVKAVRFYLLYPENIAHKGPYSGYNLQDNFNFGNVLDMADLHRKEQYLAEQNRFQANSNTPEPVRKLAWNKLPDPLASFEIITDFSPKRQTLNFRFSEKTVKALSNKDILHAELWTIGSDLLAETNKPSMYIRIPIRKYMRPPVRKEGANLVANGFIPLSDNVLSMMLFTINDPEGMRIMTDNTLKHYFIHKLADIKNQYVLKIFLNGNAIDNYNVNLNRGRDSKRKITGNRSSPELGVVQLDYEPQIDIPVAKVKKGEVHPGKHPEE